jgi:hypothetical protein
MAKRKYGAHEREYNRVWTAQDRAKNPEKYRKRERDWYWTDPVQRRADCKIWRQDNPVWVYEYQKAYRLATPEKQKQYSHTKYLNKKAKQPPKPPRVYSMTPEAIRMRNVRAKRKKEKHALEAIEKEEQKLKEKYVENALHINFDMVT